MPYRYHPMKSKLEQCVRMVAAIDEGARIELNLSNLQDGSKIRIRFHATVMTADDAQMADGEGATLDEAIDALHSSLGERAARLREALEDFEDE